MVQVSHSYMTTRKTIALTRWTFVSKVMSLLFNMLSRWMKPPPGGINELNAAHKYADPRLVGNRRLMMVTPTYLTINESEECS